MRCEKALPWLGAWEDGEVNRWRRWQIARHVRQCPNCQAEVAALARLATNLKNADPVTVHYKPLTAPSPFRLGALRYGILAATLLLALTGLIRLQGMVPGQPKTTGTAVALRPQGTPAKAPFVHVATMKDKPVARVAPHGTTGSQGAWVFRRQKHLVASDTRTRLRLRRRPAQSPPTLSVRVHEKPDASAVATTTQSPKMNVQSEIIEVSVKVCDHADIMRQMQKDAATIEAAEARRAIISVSVTLDPLEKAYQTTSAAPASTKTNHSEATYEDL